MPETRPELPFSLLLPVYAGDRADFLRRAFVSSVDEQTLRPDDVVLVQDGPLPEALRETCEELATVSPVPVNLVHLERNVGLGPALDHGLEACAHDVVARMDADDISRPRRFELQLPLIADGADIVGSALMEFVDDVEDVVQIRIPPLGPDWIRSAVRFRDPFNHPAAVYRPVRMSRTRLTEAGIDAAYLDGATRDRGAVIESFRDGDAPVFLISLKAGGVGLTLTEADYVFVLDPWWNPAAEAQAVDRAHRIGQTQHVMVYRLVSTDTIEEKVMELKERKAELFAKVVDGEGAMSSAIGADDIRALFD